MEINIPGLVGVVSFSLVCIVLCVWSTRKKRIVDRYSSTPQDESFLIAGRDIGWLVGSCSLTATFVSSIFINSTTRSIYNDSLSSTHFPWGLSLSVLAGGLLFAKKIRKSGYVTIIDPMQERYGKFLGGVLFVPAIISEVLWAGSMFGSLGKVFTVVIGDHMSFLIILVALVTIFNSVFGGMHNVAVVNVMQFFCLFVGIWIAVPFTMMNNHVTSISNTTDQWVGSFIPEQTGEHLDFALFMIFGGLPWQVFFQHIVSSRSPKQARTISFVATIGCLVMACPGILFGAVAKSADWGSVLSEGNSNSNNTGNTTTNFIMDQSQISNHLNNMGDVFPFVIKYFAPSWLVFFVVTGLTAAVMSSADSAFLSSAAMFSRNIYKTTKKSTLPCDVMRAARIVVVIVGVMATALGLTVPDFVYHLWILSCDFIYVVLFPQFLCALHVKWVNIYGSFPAIMVGSALRICGGVRELGVPPLIKYPYYDEITDRQFFPFRTLAMGCSVIVLIVGSLVANKLEERFGSNLSQDEIDILKISYKEPEMGDFSSFSKITRWSGSYNSITASALELRNKGRHEDKSLLKTTLGRNVSACSSRPPIESCDERLEL